MTWCGLPSPAPSPYARLITRSGFTSRIVRMTSSNWVTSPRTTGAPIGTPLNEALPGFKSMPTTDSPRSISRWMSRGPMKPVAPITSIDMALLQLGRLPGDHAPVRTSLGVHREIADGEPVLLAVALDVHLRHAVDDADAADHPYAAVARRDATIVRLAAAKISNVLGLRLLPRGGVHVDQVVGQRRVERGPVALLHRLEAAVVGAKHLGLDSGRRCCRHRSLLVSGAPRPAGPPPRDGLQRAPRWWRPF